MQAAGLVQQPAGPRRRPPTEVQPVATVVLLRACGSVVSTPAKLAA
ncbi:MAG TPA: hypothetical protein VD971_04460 [Phycisphaerales bacterium]|nr:hypothetical protein [Phycisphaerales bacterium]